MNTLFVVTGPSGSGKTTIMRRIMDNELISFTTRPPRKREVDGRDYIFITKEEFDELLKNNRLIEYTCYVGNGHYYGLTIEEFERKIKKEDAFFISDFNGMLQVKNFYPNVKTIFIYSSKKDVVLNMRNRGDSEDTIKKRLASYEEEVKNKHHYDYIIYNERGRMDMTIKLIEKIVKGEI